MDELHTTSTMYSRRRRNSVEYSRELPKIAECAARLSHVQTRVINSGTHLRIHTAELWGLRDNEISRANYTRGGRASLLAAELVRQSRADFRQRRTPKEIASSGSLDSCTICRSNFYQRFLISRENFLSRLSIHCRLYN